MSDLYAYNEHLRPRPSRVKIAAYYVLLFIVIVVLRLRIVRR